MKVDTDVLVIGGGLAGLSLALQLRKACPAASIRVVERAPGPFPVATHKVGESTVEIGAHYFAEILGLREHLQSRHLRKFGFRFFHSAGRDRIDDVREIGVSRFLHQPSYQIDRGILENHLVDVVRAAGVRVDLGTTVKDLALADGGAAGTHQLALQSSAGAETVAARWVVDASGRAGLLKRKYGLAEGNDHDANAVWFRVPVRIDVEAWSHDAQWLGACEPGQRWRSTNHLVGDGYWVWLIPLSSGFHSVGIVADARQHPFAVMNSHERAIEWLEKHQPRLARALREAGGGPADFAGFRGFSYGCRRLFSENRWALTGEAGVFLDPFYSPGSDFIAIANSYITDLVSRDLSGRPWVPFVGFHEQLFRSFYDSTLSLYRGQYHIFGDPEVLHLKVIWDYTYYWGVLCQLFFQERLTDLAVLATLKADLLAARELNAAMQTFLGEWSRRSRKRNLPGLLDQSELPWFVELNRGLTDSLDTPAFVQRVRDCVATLRCLAAEILATAQADYPAIAGTAEAGSVAALATADGAMSSPLLTYGVLADDRSAA